MGVNLCPVYRQKHRVVCSAQNNLIVLYLSLHNRMLCMYMCVACVVDPFGNCSPNVLAAHTRQHEGFQSPLPFIFFPVVVHAMDIVVSSVGMLFVTAAAHSATNPMDQLTRGYRCEQDKCISVLRKWRNDLGTSSALGVPDGFPQTNT